MERENLMGRFGYVLVAAFLVATGAGHAQGFLSAEVVARAVSESGPMLADVTSDAGVELLEITQALELMARCTDDFAQLATVDGEDFIYVHGYAIVSRSAWEARGAAAFEPAITASTVRAYGRAAMWFNQVATAYANALAKSDTEENRNLTELESTLLDTWSAESRQVVAESGGIAVSDDLIGGQRLGHEVYSLGNDGFCVFARWAFPVDQERVRRERGEGTGGPGRGANDPEGSGSTSVGEVQGTKEGVAVPPGFLGGGFRDPRAP